LDAFFLLYWIYSFINWCVMVESIFVRDLYKDNKERLKFKLVCSENGLNRRITTSELHRPGLALSGFTDLFTWNRIQILGNTEMSYLKKLNDDELRQSIERFIEFDIPLVIITNNNDVPDDFVQAATRRAITIIKTPFSTTQFVHLLGDYLETIFAPTTSLHGSMVDVYGIGMLFTGRSGIGKSEIALDLIERGHRLVADDLVIVKRKAEDVLIGHGKVMKEHMMEIRGVGLVDIQQIFGIRGVRIQKRVEVVVNLVDWRADHNYERVGLDEHTMDILGVVIPKITLPINPGKNVTVIAETIAMNQLLKMFGHHSAKEFNERLKQRMKEKHASPLAKDRQYLEKDWE